MREVAVALAAAHRSGVVHRDLKPTNVFLHNDRDGRLVPKILDFGVSKILEEEQNMALTIAGTVLGSPHYMSPEQAMGAADIDGRTDVFAFGGILFEALTGRRAYDAPNFNALIVTIATKNPASIDEHAPHLPEALRSVVRDCLLTNKDERLASFDLIVERLTMMLPELEPSGLHLPGLIGTEQSVTMRFSTAPPSSKPTDATLSGLQAVGTFGRFPPRTIAMAGSMLVLVAVIVGLAATLSRRGAWMPAERGSAMAAASAGAPAEPKTVASAVPNASASTEVPVISVDALPVASRTAKRTARLSVTASPGWCSVSVDGVARGVTPVTGFELTPGAHRIDCVPPTGRAQSTTITASEGSAAHHGFALEE
jgi:hypothetical protein